MCFLLVVGMFVYAQQITPVSGNAFTISPSTSSGITIYNGNIGFTISDSDRDRFIAFVDTHIQLFDDVAKIGLTDGTSASVQVYSIKNFSVSSVIRMKTEPVINLYVVVQSSNYMVEMNKKNFTDFKDALSKAYQSNKDLTDKRTSLMKYILDAQTRFAKS